MMAKDEAAGFRVGLVAAALVFAAMGLPVALGLVYVRDDLGNYLLPTRAFLARCLASGERSAWCPDLYGGFYLLGDAGGSLHPWTRGLYATLPLGTAMDVEVLWPYPAMIAGFTLLMGRWGIRRDAAVVGGLVFTFGGYHLVHYIHPTVMAGVAHLPWLLVAIDVALRSGGRREVLLARTGVSLLTLSQVLAAHVQFVWMTALVEVVFVAFVVAREPAAWRRLPGLVVSKALGCLGGAAQLWPLWEAFGESTRERPTREFLAMGSLPPLNLIQTVAPYLTAARVVAPPTALGGGGSMPAATSMDTDWRAHEFALYCGAAVPVLLTWLVSRGGALPRGRRPYAALALGLAGAALVLAFGDFTPLFGTTMRLPGVGWFRVPSRYLTLFQFGVAALTALAYADLCEACARPVRVARRRLWPLAIPPLVSLVIGLAPGLPAGLWPWYLRAGYLAPTPLVLLGPVLVGLSAALVALAARGSRVALRALPVFLACDLAAYGAHAAMVTPPRPLSAYLAARPGPPCPAGTRVKFDKLHMVGHDPYMMRGLRMVQGYAAVPPRRRLSYERPASLRVAGVEWSLPSGDEGTRDWRPVPGALPRARLVTRTLVSSDPDRDLDRIDVGTTVLTERALPAPLPDAAPGSAWLAADRPGKLDAVTDAPARQLLVVSESYHEGWRARIDGRRARVFRLNGDFLGCVVPPGRHEVRFRFRPRGEKAGALLCALSLGLIAAVPAFSRAPRVGNVPPAPHLGLRVRQRQARWGRRLRAGRPAPRRS